MTMLMPTRGPFEGASNSSERQDAARADTAEARLAMIKRFGICALTILLAGSALAGIVAKGDRCLSQFKYEPTLRAGSIKAAARPQWSRMP